MNKLGELLGINIPSEEEFVFQEECSKLVEIIFAKFFIFCRGSDTLFADETRLRAEKFQWANVFAKRNITKYSQIKKGVDKLEVYTFPNPPQLGEFLSWCEGSAEDYQFWPKETAYKRAYELLRGDPLQMSPQQETVLKHAISQSDSHFLRNNPISKTKEVFYRNYEIAIRDYSAGNLKPVPKAIEKDEPEDLWKDLKRYGGILPQYAHLTSYEKAMPVIRGLLNKNNGQIVKHIPNEWKKP